MENNIYALQKEIMKYLFNFFKCLSTKEWVSLGLQQLQPVRHNETKLEDVVVSHQMYLNDAFLGGGCLIVEKKNLKNKNNLCR